MARLLYTITNLVVKRGSANDGNSMEATWGLSGGVDWGFDGWYDEIWTFNASKNMSSATIQQVGAGPATGDIVWTRNSDGIHNSAYCYYDRSKYHPLMEGRYLTSVKADILHDNNLVSKNMYTHTVMTYEFKVPKAPEISEPSFDDATGEVTFTIDTEEGRDEYERYDTMYCVTRQDSSNRGNSYSSEKIVTAWTSTRNTSVTTDLDISDAQSITYGQWVKVTCKAYARGLRGNSQTTTKTYYYAYPAQASITSIVASGYTSTDSVTVRLNTNATDSYPVDSVKLQRLRSSTITSADAAGMASGWEDVSGAVDNGVCTGLVDYIVDAMPEVKTHTWYRLVTSHGALVRRSVPVEAECLYRDKDASADDVVKFLSLAPGADGETLVARLAWNNDDSNTTQIFWSSHEDAWESTQQPDSHDITWSDPEPASGYDNSATVSIRGLSEGTSYYVRARRALITDENSSYGDWCYPEKAHYPKSTAVAPTDVVLWAPATVERGNGIDCSWTYAGSKQTAWQLLLKDSNENVKELLSGESSTGSTTLPASSVEGMDSLLLAVSITSGGDWATSDYVPVTIADAPELDMSVNSTLTGQPLSITFGSTSPTANVSIYVTSKGVSTSTPDGTIVQASGDVVWSEVVSPAWQEFEGAWVASVTAPATLAFYDGGGYDVTATATDSQTLLSSDGVQASFNVNWAHKAVMPSEDTEITVDGLTATITPVAPSGVAETDVCDVYRLTPDGAYRIASDVPFGTSVTDIHAPFSNSGENAYRLCTRTADGDLDWTDFDYSLKYTSIYIEWDEEHVELPYNVTISDSWENGFEMRKHLDGTMAGYWDVGTSRKSRLTTDVVKVESADTREALSKLAKHAGAAFVRTPDGSAYPANVAIDSYGYSYNSLVVPVSISCEEVAMTDDFRISPDDWGEEG